MSRFFHLLPFSVLPISVLPFSGMSAVGGVLLLGLSLTLLGGCNSDARRRLAIAPAAACAAPTPRARARRTQRKRRMVRRPGSVALSDADLAPMDNYIHARNKKWVLADTVDIYASKEYFSQVLTMNTHIGMVHRKDEKFGDVEVSTLTFIGHETQRSAMANPRVMIGTGLTVSARRVLRVRMARTLNASMPVQLRIMATGDASRGQKEEVLERGAQIQMGGIIRNVNRRWTWKQIGR